MRLAKTCRVSSEMLESAIDRSGMRVAFLCDQLGISRQAFQKKREGKVPFRLSEVYVLCDLLRLDDHQKDAIFFPYDVNQ